MGGGQSNHQTKQLTNESNQLRVALKYQWRLKKVREHEPSATFVSKMLWINGEKSLRIWQNTSGSAAKCCSTDVYLGAVNLHRRGMKISDVLLSSASNGSSLMKQINGNDANTVQVFKADFVHEPCEQVDFLMYGQAQTDNFVYVLRDSSVKTQLSKAFMHNLYDPEVAVRVNGRCVMSVHKAILAARSPVLAAQIQKGEICIDFGTVDVPIVEQFMNFGYTGNLGGSLANEKLLLLAKTYQVSSLENICKKAGERVDQREVGKLMSSTSNSGPAKEKPIKSVENIPDAIGVDDSSAIYCCEWTVKKAIETGETIVSETFACKEQPLFFVAISPKTSKSSSRSDKEEGKPVEEITTHINLICCSPSGYEVEQATFYFKTSQPIGGGDLIRRRQNGVFDSFHGSIRGPITASCTFEFHVKIKNQISGFVHEMVDAKWFEDLKRVELFDVEIECGERTFNAHRVVLCARSPTFAAELEGNETEVATVNIENTSPAAVEIFLQFLYSGIAPFSAALECRVELEALATKYQVDSLRNWLATFCQDEAKGEDILLSGLSVSL